VLVTVQGRTSRRRKVPDLAVISNATSMFVLVHRLVNLNTIFFWRWSCVRRYMNRNMQFPYVRFMVSAVVMRCNAIQPVESQLPFQEIMSPQSSEKLA
jgi:hypothetical protein